MDSRGKGKSWDQNRYAPWLTARSRWCTSPCVPILLRSPQRQAKATQPYYLWVRRLSRRPRAIQLGFEAKPQASAMWTIISMYYSTLIWPNLYTAPMIGWIKSLCSELRQSHLLPCSGIPLKILNGHCEPLHAQWNPAAIGHLRSFRSSYLLDPWRHCDRRETNCKFLLTIDGLSVALLCSVLSQECRAPAA